MIHYLILGDDGLLGGYERADVLLADYAEHSKHDDKPRMIWRLTKGLATRYAPSSIDEVREDLAEIQMRGVDYLGRCA